MEGFGLYLPRIFRDQKYSNIYDIPFVDLKNRQTFISQEYFENVLSIDKMTFNHITTEMVLRGGKFILESDSHEYPEDITVGKKMIYVSVKTPKEAYNKIDFETIGIEFIRENLRISDNNFFHNIPLDGFKALYLTDTEIEILEEEFLNAGFKIYKANDHLLSLPKKSMNISMNKVSNKNNVQKGTESYEEIETSTKKSEDYTKSKIAENKKQLSSSLNSDSKYSKVNKDKKEKRAVHTNDNLNNVLYFRTDQRDEIKELPKWVEFFIEIGRFIADIEEITLYINYLDDIIPATFISLGILDSKYREYEEQFSLEKWMEKNFKRNQAVSYLYSEKSDGSKEWKKSKVLEVKKFENMNDTFNPYLILELKLPQQKPLIQQIPKTHILSKVRVGGRVRKTAGSTVYIDDKLNQRFKKLFSENTVDIIKFTNQDYINLIGHGKKHSFEKFSKRFHIYGSSNENSSGFKLSDWFYFEDTHSNLTNINVINSKASNFVEDNINIFLGANSGLGYYNFKNKKNIYLVNRMNNSIDSINRLTENLEKETMTTSTDITSTVIAYLDKKGVSLPKGVELFAYL